MKKKLKVNKELRKLLSARLDEKLQEEQRLTELVLAFKELAYDYKAECNELRTTLRGYAETHRAYIAQLEGQIEDLKRKLDAPEQSKDASG